MTFPVNDVIIPDNDVVTPVNHALIPVNYDDTGDGLSLMQLHVALS